MFRSIEGVYKVNRSLMMVSQSLVDRHVVLTYL